ncbi:MAG: hypothetical protein ABI867_38185 [Kofleriaceae bacterium]
MRSIAVVLVMLAVRTASASYVNGASDYVRDGEAVVLGRAQTTAEARAWPGPAGEQRIVVIEVIAGVWLESQVVIATAVPPGGRVVMVLPHRELRAHPELAIEAPPPRGAPIVWPLGVTDTLPRDLVAEGDDGRVVIMNRQTAQPLTLTDLRAIAKKIRPLDTGVQAKVIDAGLGKPVTGPPAVLATILDLANDAPRLAMLLESPAPAIREAAVKRLVAIAGGEPVARSTQSSPRELAAWRQRWDAWWLAQRDGRLAQRHYPAVPAPLRAPSIMQPTALVAALDAGTFATELPRWLAAGMVRDRELRGVTTDETASKWPGADIVGLSYPGQLVSVPLAELFDRALPVKQRAAALAMIVLHAHAERFAAERVVAAKLLASRPPCAPEIRTAAYWELADSYTIGPAHAAWAQLATCGDTAAIALIELAYRIRNDSPVMVAVEKRVQAKDAAFTTRLLDHMRTAPGDPWGFATILLAAGDRRVIALAIDWLRSRDAGTRSTAAAILGRTVAAEAHQPLVAAIRVETDAAARRSEVSALAGIADRRALDVLLALATSPAAATTRVTLAVALGRIKDKRALAPLAAMASTAGADSQGAQASVNAFCWISTLCPSHEPSTNTGSVDPAYIRDGLAAIAAWKQHP